MSFDLAAESGHFICYLDRTYHVLPTRRYPRT
jgi:hypothetical protein